MRITRLLAVLWVVLGILIWNGFFDLYVSRGAREYGQLRVEAERDGRPQPDMAEIQNRAKRAGLENASLWAAIVIVGGWTTIWIAGRTKRTS